ncbi:MAG: hypothetical protein JW384_03379 [Nitrosomonadaceae bacterium]|nr:hypothetical protein [Nitrosomonadaceae bacterium]
MRKNIYIKSRSFRSTPILDECLQLLSDKTNRNESCLIREAVFQFCQYYKDRPADLTKPI